MAGDVEEKCNSGRLAIMLDANCEDVEKNQSEDCDLKGSGH